jgi:hypothetical protein
VRDVAAGVVMTGYDSNRPSQQSRHFVITDNVFDGVDYGKWGGNGYLLLMLDGAGDIVVDHNTFIQGQSYGIAQIEGSVDKFVYTNNLAGVGDYGIIASGTAPGNASIRASLPGSKITGNVFGGGDQSLYPPGNLFPSMNDFRSQFVDFGNHDYRLTSGSKWLRGSTDGRAIGANVAAVPRAAE